VFGAAAIGGRMEFSRGRVLQEVSSDLSGLIGGIVTVVVVILIFCLL
jgi:hypothetical protein